MQIAHDTFSPSFIPSASCPTYSIMTEKLFPQPDQYDHRFTFTVPNKDSIFRAWLNFAPAKIKCWFKMFLSIKKYCIMIDHSEVLCMNGFQLAAHVLLLNPNANKIEVPNNTFFPVPFVPTGNFHDDTFKIQLTFHNSIDFIPMLYVQIQSSPPPHPLSFDVPLFQNVTFVKNANEDYSEIELPHTNHVCQVVVMVDDDSVPINSMSFDFLRNMWADQWLFLDKHRQNVPIPKSHKVYTLTFDVPKIFHSDPDYNRSKLLSETSDSPKLKIFWEQSSARKIINGNCWIVSVCTLTVLNRRMEFKVDGINLI